MGNYKGIFNKLEDIYSKRTGGAINLIGMSYQLYYSLYLLLKELDVNNNKIRFEGIEDIDLSNYKADLNNHGEITYIQLKHSKNTTNASTFWEKGILQNFIEVYLKDNTSKFSLVYDNNFANGNLKVITKNDFSKSNEVKYWLDKIEKFKEEKRAETWEWNNFDFEDFVNKIKFEYISEEKIKKGIIELLIDKFEVNTGNEQQYLNGLFYFVFNMSKKRNNWIKHIDLIEILEKIKQDIFLGSVNFAWKNNWIENIDFFKEYLELNEEDINYYEGIPAKPEHILKKLSVERKTFIKKITKSINSFQITVIKAASGQGKSTLAWQVCENLKYDYEFYELNWFNDEKETGDYITYFESRVKIGKNILVVIDGLNASTSKWSFLAKKLSNFPLKILITTREEDWYKYEGDTRGLSLNVENIYLEKKEAELIFKKLKEKNKIDSKVNHWQSSWEQIGDKKLIFEYIYLITKGELLDKLLRQQLKELNNFDENARAKSELLRLVCFADIIGVKIKTKKIVKFIDGLYKLTKDRGEFIKSIEKEYYINFEKEYLEGLHPLRSEKIVEILHEYVEKEESLEKLINFIESDYIYQFCSVLPIFLSGSKDKKEVYKKLVNNFSKKNYIDIKKSMEGIFLGSIEEYWLLNKHIFEKYSKNEGYIMFLATDTNPWSDLNIISSMMELNLNPELIELKNAVEKMSAFDINKSDIYNYIVLLNEELKHNQLEDDFDGLGEVLIIMEKFDVKPFIFEILGYEDLMKVLMKYHVNISKNIALSYYQNAPKKYKEIIYKDFGKIMNYLKINLGPIEAKEEKEEMNVRYYYNSAINNFNDESVDKISKLYCFLPFYEKYNSDIELPLFLKEQEIFKMSLNDAKKRMPNSNVLLALNTNLNKIWIDFFYTKFEANSIYEWQMFWFKIREESVSAIGLLIELLESILEGKNKKTKKKSEEFFKKGVEIVKEIHRMNQFPKENRPLKKVDMNKNDINEIKNWSSTLRNIITQWESLVLNSKDIVYVNIADLKEKTLKMQDSFQNIERQTFKYIDEVVSHQLVTQENKVYSKLYKTSNFYKENYSYRGNYKNVKIMIQENYLSKIKTKIDKINSILRNNDEKCSFKIIKPKKIQEKGILTNLVFGIENFDFKNDVIDLINIMVDLKDIGVHYYSVILIKEGVAQGGLRFIKDKISEYQNGNIDIEELVPLPLSLDAEIMSILGGFKIQEKVSKADEFIDLLTYYWQLKKIMESINISTHFNKTIRERLDELDLDENKDKIRTKLERNLKFMKLEEYEHEISKIYYEYIEEQLLEL